MSQKDTRHIKTEGTSNGNHSTLERQRRSITIHKSSRHSRNSGGWKILHHSLWAHSGTGGSTSGSSHKATLIKPFGVLYVTCLLYTAHSHPDRPLASWLVEPRVRCMAARRSVANPLACHRSLTAYLGRLQELAHYQGVKHDPLILLWHGRWLRCRRRTMRASSCTQVS